MRHDIVNISLQEVDTKTVFAHNKISLLRIKADTGSDYRVKVKDVITKVQSDGWFFKRMRGDHRIYHHSTKTGIVVVAGKLSDEMPVGTYHNVMRQAGLPK